MSENSQVTFDNTEVAFSYKSDKELKRAKFIFSIVNHPWVSATATAVVKAGLALRLPIKGIIRQTVFNHFCGGESMESAESTILHLAKYKVNTILDYSAEGEKSEAGFDSALREILRTFEKAKDRSSIPFCVFKASGIVDAGLLERVQAQKDISSEDLAALTRAKERINKICARAYEMDVPILIDAEETWIQDVLDSMVYEMMERYNHERAIVFNTYQLYRTDALFNMKQAFEAAKNGGYFVGVKLVRGAYMEKERKRAEEHGYPSPIFPDKEGTDHAFNQSLQFCIENADRITVMCGSHNEYSNQYLGQLMNEHGMAPSDERVWFAQLYGMSDNISFNLAEAGYNVAKYVPYGPVHLVMPYLLRRAEENTSVAGQSSRELMMIMKEIERRAQASRS